MDMDRKQIQSHVAMKTAVEKVGVKQVARALGVSATLVYKWCESQRGKESEIMGSGSANPLDRIEKLYQVTRDDGLIRWLNQKAGGFFARNPAAGPGRVEPFFDNIQHLVKEFSDTLDAVSSSYKAGDEIDAMEAQRIRREWEELKSVGESLVCSCEAGRYMRKKTRAKGE